MFPFPLRLAKLQQNTQESLWHTDGVCWFTAGKAEPQSIGKRAPSRIQKGHRGQTFLLSMSQLFVKSRKDFSRSNVGFTLDIFIYGEKKIRIKYTCSSSSCSWARFCFILSIRFCFSILKDKCQCIKILNYLVHFLVPN